MKMGFVFPRSLSARGDHSLASLQYADNNFPGHAGWKEIIAVAPTASLIRSSSVPQADRSAALTNYPTDLLNSPPQDLSAAIQFRYPVTGTAGPSTALRSGRDDNSVVGNTFRVTNKLSSRPKRSVWRDLLFHAGSQTGSRRDEAHSASASRYTFRPTSRRPRAAPLLS